jgi:hypothetical protein
MPMIRCPHCQLRQYAPATHATLSSCVGCGRPFAVESVAVIARLTDAARELRRRSRRGIASDGS